MEATSQTGSGAAQGSGFEHGAIDMNVDGIHTQQMKHAPVVVRAVTPRAATVAGRSGSGVMGDVRRFAMLEREQEMALARRWRDAHDSNAAHQLVTSHLRLAAKVAMSYRGYGLPISEIISEGNVGLMQAVN